MKYTAQHPGRETQAPTPDVWHEHTQQVIALRDQLSRIPVDDRATWAIVAKETSAAFAAWSERLEPTPGPLADASRSLARGAQIRAHQVKPRPSGMASAAGAAMLFAMAAKGGQGTAAEALLFRQIMKTAQTLHGMYQASTDALEAARIRDALGAKLDAVRERLPQLQGASTSAPVDPRAAEAARIAQAGQAPFSAPRSPIRQPLEPRPTTNVTPTERGGHER